MPGILNISLDFELHWGVFDKKQLDAPGKRYFENTRRVIPQMIALFRQYEAHVTWAVVGMLYHPNAQAWRQQVPPRLPAYQNPSVSSYRWVEENELLEPSDPYHFAPDLIALLEQEPLFEIGTHTYSHFYCQEAGQTPEQFESDLQKAIEMAQSRGHQLRSLVFPRNQFNPAYLQVCRDKGIETVRSNPDVWYWDAARPESLLKKLFRTGDAYTTVLGKKVVPLSAIDVSRRPLELPASRFYRAWTPSWPLLNQLKMQRILQEMEDAANEKGYYHLWWHPHNFGLYPDHCLRELEIILKQYRRLQGTKGLLSMTMDETRRYLLGFH